MRGGWMLALASCSAAPIEVEVPGFDGAETTLVVIERGAALQGSAFATRAARDLPYLEAFSGEAEIHVLHYRRTPEALGLEPGPLMDRSERAPLGAADRVLSARLAGGELGPWTEAPRLPAAIARLRLVHPPRPCPEFVLDRIEVPIQVGFTFSVATSSSSALLGTYDAELYRLDLAPRPRIARQATTGDILLWAQIDERGWHFGGTQGRLWTAPAADPSATQLLAKHPLGSFHELAISPPGAPFELYAMDNEGLLVRYAQGLTVLEEVRRARDTMAVRYLGPARAVAVDASAPATTLLVEGDRARREPAVIEGCSTPWIGTLAVRGARVLAGNECGMLLERVDERWEIRGQTPSREPIHALLPIEDGVFYAAENGTYGVFFDDGRICEPGPTSNADIENLSRVGDRFVLSGTWNEQFAQQIVSLVRIVDR